MNHTEGVTVKEAKKTLPDGWRWVRLGEACEINPRRSASLQRADNAPTTFVPMSAVDERSASIVRAEVRPFADVQKGYTYFEEGDVLFAKITPCMQNGKHAIARDLIGGVGFGTTEFHVLRPSPAIISEWIHCFLRQPTVLGAATAYFTGAVGQQRVPDSYLARLEIPLPPLPEQKHIAAILNEQMAAVERARAAAEEQLKAAKALPAAYLRAVFNSPEALRWPIKNFEEVAILQRGFDLPSQAQIPGEYPIVTSAGISGTHNECKAKGPGVVTGRSGSIGKVYFVEKDYWPHNTALYVKDFKNNEPRYVYFLLQWLDLEGLHSGSGVPTLDRKWVHKVLVPCPPREVQTHVALALTEQIEGVERVKKVVGPQLNAINKLPAALLRRAFNGEL